MRRNAGVQIMIVGAVLLLAWFLARVLSFLLSVTFYVGLLLVIIGALVYLLSPRR